MKDVMEDVATFMQLAGQKPDRGMSSSHPDRVRAMGEMLQLLATTFDSVDSGLVELRARLMLSELGETLVAMVDGKVGETADGLVDLVYVVAGTGVAFDLPLAEVWEAVHAANMAKFVPCPECAGFSPFVICEVCAGRGEVPVLDEGGKVQKPEGWEAPDVAAIVRRHHGSV